MAQWDVVLVQNVHATLTEFAEKVINVPRGGIITSTATGRVPSVLSPGTDGQVLSCRAGSAGDMGIEWITPSGGAHTQNTDTGTTATSWVIDSTGTPTRLKNNAGGLDIRNNGDTLFTSLRALNVTVDSVNPTGAYELCHKTYVDSVAASWAATADAMIFKGTIGTAGTHTIAAFNALTTYNAGWTYRVIEAGTIRGIVCEIGDLVMVLVDRTGSGNVNADFTVVQTNNDGTVIGPASAVSGNIASFSGTSGKLVQDSGIAISALSNLANYVVGPASATSGNVAVYSGTTGKLVQDSTIVASSIVIGPASATSGNVAVYNGATGKLIQNSTIIASSIVLGPASVTDNYAVVFDGTTGKLIKAGTGPLGTAAYVATGTFATAAQGTTADNAIPKATFTATGNEIIVGSAASTYAPLAVTASTFVGRIATGNVIAMSTTQARTLLNVADGATANTKASAAEIATGTDDVKFLTALGVSTVSSNMLKWVARPAAYNSDGTAGQIAYDTTNKSWLYICVTTGSGGTARWIRIATPGNQSTSWSGLA